MGEHRLVACLGENTMVDLLEQRLPEGRLASVHTHLEECDLCRELVAAAAGALDSSLDIEDEPTHIAPLPMTLRSDLGPGSRIDHYRIERLLGQGGMGEVYQAHDPNLDRKVALKVIKAELLERDKGYEMFLTEARATARLAHPNIVTIHAVGAYQGQPYVALELLVGHTLRDRLLMDKIDPALVVKISLAIAEALVAAHAASVFHRDLKPGNVMLCADGRTRVLDFGLAMIADADVIAAVRMGRFAPTLDGTIALAGTPAYMAPEQWAAEPVTGAADVWALGVLMFEMLTGKRPYDHLKGEGAATTQVLVNLAKAIRSPDSVPVAQALEALAAPAELRRLITRCLRKDPADRPTAEQVVEALRPLELQHTVSAMSLPGGPLGASAPPRTGRGRAGRVIASAVAATLLSAAGAWRLWPTHEPLVARRLPPAALAPSVEIAAPSESVAAPAFEASAERPPSSARRALPRSSPPPPATSAAPSWDPMSYR